MIPGHTTLLLQSPVVGGEGKCQPTPYKHNNTQSRARDRMSYGKDGFLPSKKTCSKNLQVIC